MKLLKAILITTILIFLYVEIKLYMLWDIGGLDYYINSPLLKDLEITLLITISILTVSLLFLKLHKLNKL